MYLYESKSKNKKYTIVMEDEKDINNDALTHSTLHKKNRLFKTYLLCCK